MSLTEENFCINKPFVIDGKTYYHPVPGERSLLRPKHPFEVLRQTNFHSKREEILWIQRYEDFWKGRSSIGLLPLQTQSTIKLHEERHRLNLQILSKGNEKSFLLEHLHLHKETWFRMKSCLSLFEQNQILPSKTCDLQIQI